MPKTLLLLSLFYILSCAHENTVYNNNASRATRIKVVNQAQTYLGIPYSTNGRSPQTGFDCSGFIVYVFKEFGYPYSGSAKDLAAIGHFKDKKDLKAGDLVFFGSSRHIQHVGLVVSHTPAGITMIHSSTQLGISEENIDQSDYWRERFLFGKDPY